MILKTLLCVIATFVLLLPITASAQSPPPPGEAGPYAVVLEENRGPYHVRIWQSPERSVAGVTRFIVELRDHRGTSVDGASITVYADPQEEGRRQKSLALNAPLNPELYHVSLDMDEPDEWAIQFLIAGPSGTIQVDMPIIVSARGRSGTFDQPATWLFIGIQISLIASVALLWWNGRRKKAILSQNP